MSIALALAAAWRIAFLTASAPVIGACCSPPSRASPVALWAAIDQPPIAMRLVIVGAALIGIAQIATPLPPHLALWMNPAFVGARAVIAAGLLAVAGARLRDGGSVTGAAIALAVYAALVTPIANRLDARRRSRSCGVGDRHDALRRTDRRCLRADLVLGTRRRTVSAPT